MNEPIMNYGWYDARVNPPSWGEILVIFENGNKGFLYWAPNDSLKYRHVRYWRPFPKSPEPDPFEEWWNQQPLLGPRPHDTSEVRGIPGVAYCMEKESARAVWNAGVQWARKNAAAPSL